MFKVYKYNLPFRAPFKTGAGTFTNREGLIVRYAENGSEFLSEIAPLPGFSIETLHDVSDALISNNKLLETFISGPFSKQELCAFLDTLPDIPSLKFGISTLGLFILAERSGITLPELLNRPLQKNVRVNAVIGTENPVNLKHLITKQYQAGFRVVKCKIKGDPSYMPELLTELSSEFPDLIFRLDANQTWNFSTIEKFSEQFRKLPVEYVEEPVKLSSARQYQDLINRCKLPIAADESITQFGFSELVTQPFSPPYFILKPMFIGNLMNIFETINHQKHLENRVIFTTAFESAVGRRVISLIAGMFGSRESAHGLNTGMYFSDDLASENNIQNGMYKFIHGENKLYNFNTINPSNLELVL